MISHHGFHTLVEFETAIQSTRISTPTKTQLSLIEGLDTAVKMLRQVKEKNKKLIFIGNGASAAMASHHSVDIWKNGGIKAVAFNDSSLLTCISNDYSFSDVFAKPMECFGESQDVLVAISSSGASPNIIKAVEAARKKGCEIITFSGFRLTNPLSKLGDLNFLVPSQTYGVVESAHTLLIHSVTDEYIRRFCELAASPEKTQSQPLDQA